MEEISGQGKPTAVFSGKCKSLKVFNGIQLPVALRAAIVRSVISLPECGPERLSGCERGMS